MNFTDLNFDSHLPAALAQLNRPFRRPPPASLPGASRTATALEEATRHWRRRCGLAAQQVGEQLTQLRAFTVELADHDRELAENFGAYR